MNAERRVAITANDKGAIADIVANSFSDGVLNLNCFFCLVFLSVLNEGDRIAEKKRFPFVRKEKNIGKIIPEWIVFIIFILFFHILYFVVTPCLIEYNFVIFANNIRKIKHIKVCNMKFENHTIN